MNQRITVYIRYRAKEDKIEELKGHLQELIDQKKAEGSGCIQSELHQAFENGRHFILFELWENREYLRNHSADKKVKELESEAKILCEAPPDRKVLAQKTKRDEQTGVWFELEDEDWWDCIFANLSFFYLFFMLLFLAMVLVATWEGVSPWGLGGLTDALLGLKYSDLLKNSFFKLFCYAAIGGGLGAVLSGLQSVFSWHFDLKAFGKRFFVRDLGRPVFGATLAVVAYGLFRIGFGVLGGNVLKSNNGAIEALWSFSVGVLAGFSWHEVFVWLGDVSKRIFKLKEVKQKEKSGPEETPQ